MFVLLVLSGLLAAAPQKTPATLADTKGQTLARWYEGPVRYILTRREEKEFRTLREDAVRSEFIRTFWRKRDPNPETAENEARIAFWRRVVESNSLFQDSPRPGWMTDRGKIYILVGAPNEIQEDTNYNARDRNIAGRGLTRWLYEGALRSRRIGGTFIVPFVRGNDGEYHLSTSAQFSSPAFDPLNPYEAQTPQIARIQSTFDYAASDLGVALDQGLILSPPWQDKDLIDRVTAEAYLGALPMRVGFDFLRAADGSTFALINCAIPVSAFAPSPQGSTAGPSVTVVARLSPEAGGEPIDVGEGSFAPSPGNEKARGEDVLVYQARIPLRPGKYDLYIGLFDRIRMQAANLRSSIEIPDLGGALELSSIALGSSIRQLPEGAGGYNRPFRVSDFEFIPAVDASYRSGQTLAALWQIYAEGAAGRGPEPPSGAGAAAGSPSAEGTRSGSKSAPAPAPTPAPTPAPAPRSASASGSPAASGSGLQVSSQFYRTANGEERPVGKPRVVEDAEAVQGYSVELIGWPAGSYRLEVTVHDRQGRTASRSASFRIL